jgi:hypothetical protein
MNFWRKGVGWEWIFVIARSLELRALPYALNRPPRAAASFAYPASGNVAIASLFQFGCLGRALPEPVRSATLRGS